jgi:toxin HigB-1
MRVYYSYMIKSFNDKETQKIYQQIFSKKLPHDIQRVALRKLIMIDNAACLEDLRVPPANHLEALRGDREGQYSIRINGQYRICFTIVGQNDFYNVEIIDYH